MAGPEDLRGAMAYWGAIQRAVSQRATTAQIWSAIREDAAAQPGGAPLPTLAGVNAVRSMAASVRNGGERLMGALETERRTGLPQGITDRMMSTGVGSRDAEAIATMAQYHVRFQGTFRVPDGSQLQQWLTVKFDPSNMPRTAGQLADALQVGIPNNSPPAGAELVDFDSIQITVV